MKLTRSLLSLFVSSSLGLLSFVSIPVQQVSAQDTKVSIQRGYRTGYSDGYMAGYRDSIENSAKNFSRHGDYLKADRAYSRDYGTLEDYRDGYQQGFESGYTTGYEKRSFESTVPENLRKRGSVTAALQPQPEVAVEPAAVTEEVAETPAVSTGQAENAVSYQSTGIRNVNQLISFTPVSDAVIIIPKDTELIVEILDEMGTERNKEGDKFFAKVVSPSEIAGALIEGRVSKIQKPGRIKKRSEMTLTFDRILLSETRWANLGAVLAEVLPAKGDNVKSVNEEGTAVGKSTVKGDSIKIGGATGTGIVVGAIAGGPVGAAVGAGVGAAFGVGAVIIEKGKNIKLKDTQQLRIKTTFETQIR
ncbi:MAG: hypothetical protein WBD22_11960 [Pyrinomonadaceae bacterium]